MHPCTVSVAMIHARLAKIPVYGFPVYRELISLKANTCQAKIAPASEKYVIAERLYHKFDSIGL